MIREFIADLRSYSFRTAVWNLRFNIAFAILPGSVKRVAILDADGDGIDVMRGEGGDDLGEFAAAHVS